MAKKIIRVTLSQDERQNLLALIKKDPNLSGALKVAKAFTFNDKKNGLSYDMELEVNGMMTYDLWAKFCKTINRRIPFPAVY